MEKYIKNFYVLKNISGRNFKKTNEIIEPYKAAGYTAITCLDNIDGVASYSVRFKSIKDIENICDNISDR